MEQAQALTLPNERQFRADLIAINKFQQTCQKLLLKGHDFGAIPGTQKPTLLKPGAEKITKILGLSDQYNVTQRIEEWERGFFHYEIKCTLCHLVSGVVVSEGIGSCNSMEGKYRYRWVFPDDVPEGIDHSKLVKKTGKRKDGKGTFTQYRLENEDIYSQVNTLLKMAEKRSLIDAALHAGRLSDLFTQDIEDTQIGTVEKDEPVKPAAKKREAAPIERSPLSQRGKVARVEGNDVPKFETEADPSKPTLGDLQSVMTANRWATAHVVQLIKGEKQWEFTIFSKLTPEQIGELMEYIQKHPKD